MKIKVTTIFIILLTLLHISLDAQNSYKDPVFTEYFRRPGPGWVASDATISIPLPDGRVLWLMGDTNLDDYNPADTTMPCLFQVRNSILLQDATNRNKIITILDSTQTGVNRTPVKLRVNDTTLLWPGHGFVKGDTVYSYWARYHHTSLKYYGMYLVKIHWPSLKNASSIKSAVALPNTTDTEYGNAVLVSRDSAYVYLYGHRQNTFIFDLYVARIPYDNLNAPWEYYDGTSWVTDASKAQKLNPTGYVSPSFSVVQIGQKYYLITQEIGFLTCGYGRRIYSCASSSPVGPFENRQTIYVIRDKYKDGYLITYNATAHPEFNANNELLVSYNVNNTCPELGVCKNAFTSRYNADLYRPKFIRVPFAVLDTGIFMQPEPELSIKFSTTDNHLVTFDASKSVARGDILTHTWNFGDGTKDSTTNMFIRSVSHRYAAPGVYTARVTISDGKLTASRSVLVNITSTGLIQEYKPEFSVFPNPSEGTFMVRCENTGDETWQIRVFNALGREVYFNPESGNDTSIRLNSGGMYMVRISRGNYLSTHKLIIHSKL